MTPIHPNPTPDDQEVNFPNKYSPRLLHYRAVVFIFLIHCVPGEVVERCPRFLFVYTFTAMYTSTAIHAHSLLFMYPKTLFRVHSSDLCSLLVWVALLINVTSKPQAAHYRRPRHQFAIGSLSAHYRRPRLSARYRPPCGLPNGLSNGVSNGVSNL